MISAYHPEESLSLPSSFMLLVVKVMLPVCGHEKTPKLNTHFAL
jgi:hypothetical protein